jgi:hypothetical protein
VLRVRIANVGAKSVVVDITIGSTTSTTVAAGAEATVSLLGTGNGSADVMMRFSALLAGDSLDFIAWEAVVQRYGVDENLVPSVYRDFTGWNSNGGAAVTQTQNQNQRIYKLLADATADASGYAVLDVRPVLRNPETLLNGDAIVTANTAGVFRLADDRTIGRSTRRSSTDSSSSCRRRTNEPRVTAAVKAEAKRKEIMPVLFYEGEFVSGFVRVWSGPYPIQWNSQTWQGLGQLCGVTPVSESAGLRADGIVCTVSGVPNNMVQKALNECRHSKRGTLWLGFLDRNRNLIAIRPFSITERWTLRRSRKAARRRRSASGTRKNCSTRIQNRGA